MSVETELQGDIGFEYTDYLDSEKAVLGFLKEGLTNEVLSSYERFSEEIQLPYIAMLKITNDNKMAESKLEAMITNVIAEIQPSEEKDLALSSATINEVIQALHHSTHPATNTRAHI